MGMDLNDPAKLSVSMVKLWLNLFLRAWTRIKAQQWKLKKTHERMNLDSTIKAETDPFNGDIQQCGYFDMMGRGRGQGDGSP